MKPVLLSQDEARFPMVPAPCRTLGAKGHRPTAGARDCKELLCAFAVVNAVTAALHANTPEGPAGAARKAGRSKARRPQGAFAAHLRHVGSQSPAGQHKRVVLLIDNAPWHAGDPVTKALADNPHLALKPLPSYGPQLNGIERFWKALRRRATHNRHFDSLADLKGSVRNCLRYFQTARGRTQTLLKGCCSSPQPERTTSPGL
ncbi:MAG TPA: transposase [Gemmataceae bacterium]|nr:transposase [Gemmataceae bacterium]